jgi:hypothetical protein
MLVTVTFFLLFIGYERYFVVWNYMRPYNQLVKNKATESMILKQEGKPWAIVTDDASLLKWRKSFPLRDRRLAHLGNKAIIYPADPWGDQDGFVVYIFIDERRRATDAILAGH